MNDLPLASPATHGVLEPVRTRIHREMLNRLDLNQLEKMPSEALRAELQWLAAQGFLTAGGRDGFLVAAATVEGVDVARGRAAHPDIQRPSPRR